jgi:hypothetical protein
VNWNIDELAWSLQWFSFSLLVSFFALLFCGSIVRRCGRVHRWDIFIQAYKKGEVHYAIVSVQLSTYFFFATKMDEYMKKRNFRIALEIQIFLWKKKNRVEWVEWERLEHQFKSDVIARESILMIFNLNNFVVCYVIRQAVRYNIKFHVMCAKI